MGLVPVVDLADADASVQIDRACRDVGFVQIVGHGIDGSLEQAAWSAAAEFRSTRYG